MSADRHFTVCEPVALGYEHVPVNAGLLSTIRFAFPEATIAFHGDASHLELVRAQVGPELAGSIQWVTITNPARPTSFFKRLPTDFRRVRELLLSTAPVAANHVLVFSFGNASMTWSLKALVSTKFRKRNAQVVLHGDFATLKYRTSLKFEVNPLYHVGSFKTAVRFGCLANAQYLVLEDAVRNAVIAKYPKLADRFRVLDHPVPGDLGEVEAIPLSSPVRFGFLGRATEPKGFSRYLEVAKEISERFPGQASFSFVGFLADTQTNDSLPNLVYLQDGPTHDKLDRDEYVRRANELHFVCMFYEKEYEFAASGVLADAIEWEKPLIASQLPLFADVERKFPGSAYISERANFGQVIEQILTNFDPEYYEKQLQAIRELKHSRTPAVLADTYRLLVTELNRHNDR